MDLGQVQSAILKSHIPYAREVVDFLTADSHRVTVSAAAALQAYSTRAIIADERGASIQGYARLIDRLHRQERDAPDSYVSIWGTMDQHLRFVLAFLDEERSEVLGILRHRPGFDITTVEQIDLTSEI